MNVGDPDYFGPVGEMVQPATATTYTVTLRAERSTIDPVIRLRRFLKLALRSFNLRAIDVREARPE